MDLRMWAYAGLGRRDGSRQAGRGGRGVRQGPQVGPGRLGIGRDRAGPRRAFESAGKSDDALAAYARAQEEYGKTESGSRAALSRARLLAKLGKNAEAAVAFERLLADPDARPARQGRAGRCAARRMGLVAVRRREAGRHRSRLLAAPEGHPESPYAADARFDLAESANKAHDSAEVIRLLSPLAVRKLADDPEPARAPGHEGTADPALRVLPAALYRLGRTQVEVQDLAHAA